MVDGIHRCKFCCSETVELKRCDTSWGHVGYICGECEGKTFTKAERLNASRRMSHYRYVEKNRLRMRSALYGVPMELVEQMREQQGNKCKTCGKEASAELQRGLNVDHDHKTGKVRGLLCASCNHVIGRVGDNPARLRAIAQYLEASAWRPASAEMGSDN